MIAEIKTKNVLIDGKKYKQIVEINGILKFDEFPKNFQEYLKNNLNLTAFWKIDKNSFVLRGKNFKNSLNLIPDQKVYSVGNLISEEEFTKVLELMREAGEIYINFKKHGDWIGKIETHKI